MNVTELISQLKEHTFLELVYWKNLLNNWQWADDMPLEKPVNFDILTDKEKFENEYIKMVMAALDNFVSHKEMCRFNAFILLGKTNAEFNTEWKKHWG